MTPEQMRELADRLSDPCSPDDDDLETAADYLRQCAEQRPVLVRTFNVGYMQGHHDTVEGQFTDIHQSDMDTYHADVVAELGLVAAPAAPQAEPVAWAATDESGTVVEALGMNQSRRFDTALYLAPPARKPLSDEQVYANDRIMAVNARIGLLLSEIMEIVRAVERAHGIGGSDER